MKYLHTMVRISDPKAALAFYCDGLGLTETRQVDSPQGRFTLIFLAAPADCERAAAEKAPLLELTHKIFRAWELDVRVEVLDESKLDALLIEVAFEVQEKGFHSQLRTAERRPVAD